VERWAKDIDKLHRLDGHPWDRIAAVAAWSQADPFWQANILSGAKLREKFDQLQAQMIKAGKRPGGSGLSSQAIWDMADKLEANGAEGAYVAE